MISSIKTSLGLAMIVNGSTVSYTPKSLNGIDITVGTVVTLPPGDKSIGDTWSIGFNATVDDCDDLTGSLLVVDSSGEWFSVEPDRVVVGDVSPEEFNRLLSERDARISEAAAIEFNSPVVVKAAVAAPADESDISEAEALYFAR